MAAFAARLERYQRHLKRLDLPDPAVRQFSKSGGARDVFRMTAAVLGFPVALYGWVHRLAPALFVDWAVRRFTIMGARKAQTPHVTMLAGAVRRLVRERELLIAEIEMARAEAMSIE